MDTVAKRLSPILASYLDHVFYPAFIHLLDPPPVYLNLHDVHGEVYRWGEGDGGPHAEAVCQVSQRRYLGLVQPAADEDLHVFIAVEIQRHQLVSSNHFSMASASSA
jgi:hypothetical protein